MFGKNDDRAKRNDPNEQCSSNSKREFHSNVSRQQCMRRRNRFGWGCRLIEPRKPLSAIAVPLIKRG
jgi:hypothetical protein